MAISALETKAHELIGQIGPSKLAAVVHLLEVMAEDEEEEITAEDRSAVAASREYFRQGGEGLSFEQAIAECGFTMEQVRGSYKGD